MSQSGPIRIVASRDREDFQLRMRSVEVVTSFRFPQMRGTSGSLGNNATNHEQPISDAEVTCSADSSYLTPVSPSSTQNILSAFLFFSSPFLSR
jgi:hypothetical protein